jgi:hypothetical protein
VFHYIGNTLHSNKYSVSYNQSGSEINWKIPLILGDFNLGFKGFNVVCKIQRFWIYRLSIDDLLQRLSNSYIRTRGRCSFNRHSAGLRTCIKFEAVSSMIVVGIATRHGLDVLGVKSRWKAEPYFPHPSRPALRPTQCVLGPFPREKRPGRNVGHPPPSSAEVKERVEVYNYSPFGPSWPVVKWTILIFRDIHLQNCTVSSLRRRSMYWPAARTSNLLIKICNFLHYYFTPASLSKYLPSEALSLCDELFSACKTACERSRRS